ncbi:MAG: HAMP domain-containing protein [Solirubrobacterales bacterium]|nr:HAMP domain-containing protein [Solirubrobacterales bacterium]
MRVNQWFAIAAALIAAATVAGVVAGVLAIVNLDDRRKLTLERLDPAAIEALRLNKALLDQETGVRGFVLAGEASFLRPYRVGRGEEVLASSRLERLLDDGGGPLPAIADDVAAVDRAARAWRTRYAVPTIARVRADGPGAVGRAGVRRGQELFADVRGALAGLDGELSRARREGRADLRDAATVLALSFAAIALLVAAVLAVTLLMLRRSVTLPIGALARRVRTVSHGDFDTPVLSSGPRDIAALAADIDLMRQRILDDLAESRAAAERLDEQARELERSNAELEQFAYVASHDLQEPLRKVASFCQLLEQRYKGQLDERADQYIEFAVDGAKRMQALINDLLAFSRVGRMSGDLKPVDLGEAAGAAVDALGRALAEADGRVEIGELPTVLGEQPLLTAVFQNLIANAIKFRSDAPPDVRIDAAAGDGEWTITCSDNGIGIEPEYAERVFVIFQRLHAKDRYGGTGIGLAMCRKIVEYHGGAIWLEETAGPGTTFRFTLPMTEEDR